MNFSTIHASKPTGGRFTTRFFARTPYLHEFPGGIGSEANERRLIKAGEIRPMGFRYVGRRR